MSSPNSPAPPPPSTTGPGGDDWQRLHPRTVPASTLLTAGSLLAAAVPVAVGLLIAGVGVGWTLFWTLGGALIGSLVIGVIELIRVRVTRYRIDEHRIEKTVTFLGSTHSALATERIRNVEISADLVQRRLGLASVKLASGEADGTRFSLECLDRTSAEQLRSWLLRHRNLDDGNELVNLDRGWVRYAPATIWTPLFGLIAFGGLFQVANWFNAVPAMIAWFSARTSALPLPAVILGLLLLALVVGTIATVAIFIEGWWNYRLDRHRDGSLELRRGLLIGRHTSFDGRRVRGVTLHEPPGLRRLGAARLDVIAVGVKGEPDSSGQPAQSPALVPPSPRGVSTGVAEAVLGGAVDPVDLRPHPPQARSRRLFRAGWVTLAAALGSAVPVLFWPGLWWIPLATPAPIAAVAVLIALDNARGLGHRIDPHRVTLRKGSLGRRTDLLSRDGLLGWNLRQSPFQRRARLVTLVATSAGGSGAFRLPDLGEHQAAELMDTAGSVWDHLRTSATD